ncbi:MAG: transcription-repair coupling factor, partial [Treponemataceae bacterium]
QVIDPINLAEKLIEQGYVRVPRVSMKGEFAFRGEVFDIFMAGDEHPYRIVFDFDTIEKITRFSAIDQSSITQDDGENIESVTLYPLKEVIWTDELITQLQKALQEENEKHAIFPTHAQHLIETLITHKEAEGEELFYNLLFKSMHNTSFTVFDCLQKDTKVIFCDYDRQLNATESLEREYLGMYRKAKAETEVPLPTDILLNFESLTQNDFSPIYLRSRSLQEMPNENTNQFAIETDPARSFFGNINFLKEELDTLQKNGWKCFIYADNENQALRIGELLKNYKGEKESKENDDFLTILPYPLSNGFSINDLQIIVIQENEIFGRRKFVPKSIKSAKSEILDTFVELNPDDYVVHVNYGIGQFLCIERVKALGNERDYIKLLYADDEILFLPIEQVNLIQRYIGNEGDNPRLDRIGSKSWENRKNKVKKSVEDIAHRLIALYSKRKTARGFAFPKDGEWQLLFEAAFPYEETEDQITCIDDVKKDMEQPVPMDRLICGDVGYGKTEVALRSAFKAVMEGKQVAFLAPTTILAEQHYENCLERFKDFPVRIAHLSRFVDKKDQRKTLAQLKLGEVDILIGTHRIIQKDIEFKDLGLLIIDEEQRFGVKDKEKLKEFKTNVDSLSMSATPIPRTLHMSLLKIRDMSILNTPPQNRHPIKTIIDCYSDERVATAIRQEVERGGQIFFLHNRVETLPDVQYKLQQILPELLIDSAHGQMSAHELDDIFRRFKIGGFHVLVSTTIIENGIDIPNVNTIIIDRADMYGISQLYQLRGRVGRSDRKAYAYLLYPENKSLSEIAMKRLQVISDFTELGSGFKIAMKDMEIRGAGNLLGRDQSGDVYSIGFDLYLRLLEDAIRKLQDENYQSDNEVLLELEYSGFIPDDYIQNVQIKMEVYKKIAIITSSDELERVHAEILDRFGPIPDEVLSLLGIAQIRIMCKDLHITTLRERGGLVRIEFSQVAHISVDKVVRLIQQSNGKVKIDPQKPNLMTIEIGKIGLKEKSEFITNYLSRLI